MRQQNQHPLREFDYLNENSNIGMTHNERREHIITRSFNILARLVGIDGDQPSAAPFHSGTQPGKLISKKMAWKSILNDMRFPVDTPIKNMERWHQNPRSDPSLSTPAPAYINDLLVVNTLCSQQLIVNSENSKQLKELVLQIGRLLLLSNSSLGQISRQVTRHLSPLVQSCSSENNIVIWLLYAYSIATKDFQNQNHIQATNHKFVQILHTLIPKSHPRYEQKVAVTQALAYITHCEKQTINNAYIRCQNIKGKLRPFSPNEQHFILMITNTFGSLKKRPKITDEIALSNQGSLNHLIQTFFEYKIDPSIVEKLEQIHQQPDEEIISMFTTMIMDAIHTPSDDEDDPFVESYDDYQRTHESMPKFKDVYNIIKQQIFPSFVKSVKTLQDERNRQLNILSLGSFDRSLQILLLLFHHNERYFKPDDDKKLFDGVKFSGYRTRRSSTLHLEEFNYLKNKVHSAGLKNDIFDLLALLEWRPSTLAGRENFTASRLPETRYLIFEGICNQLKSEVFMSIIDDIYYPKNWLVLDIGETPDSQAIKDFLLNRIAIYQPQNNLHKASYQVYKDLLFKRQLNLDSLQGSTPIGKTLRAYQDEVTEKIDDLVAHLQSCGMDETSVYYCLLSIAILPPDGTRTALAKLVKSCLKLHGINGSKISALSEILNYPRSDLRIKAKNKKWSYYRHFFFQHSQQIMSEAVKKVGIQSISDNPIFNGNINGLKSEQHLGESNLACVSASTSFLATATRNALHIKLKELHNNLSQHCTNHQPELSQWIERTIQETHSGNQYLEWFKSYLGPRQQSIEEAISQAFTDMSTFYENCPDSIKDSWYPNLIEIFVCVSEFFRPAELSLKVPKKVTTEWFELILGKKRPSHTRTKNIETEGLRPGL